MRFLRGLGIAVGVAVVAVAVVVAAGALWITSESTECFASFPSRDDAEPVERALEEASGVGVGAGDGERRRGRWSFSFTSGASGQDAEALTEAFEPTVREHGGTLAHPSPGCVERRPIH